jgi:hypothetical protein
MKSQNVRYINALLLAGVCASAFSNRAVAQTPAPSFPLYCQGPLVTGAHSPPPSGPTSTPFKWSGTGAGAASPGPGECAWADRGPRGTEILPGDSNVICDSSGNVASLPAGKFLEVGVYRDTTFNNCMHVTHFVGISPVVQPPFSAVPALPPFVRPSIATLLPTQLSSLRNGFQVMMSRAATDPTSFRFQANIHGTTDPATTPLESTAWNQCEHGSFYFFSWHRMYLYMFERILRAASGDPNLALPYWNWSDPAQSALPIAFREPSDASNPLFIPPSPNADFSPVGRPIGVDNGTEVLPASDVSFANAFAYTNFDSPAGSGLSFGGQEVAPLHFNSPHGELESQPHDVVHGDLAGLMGDPDFAAQDPIFWLHHANIDRLWNRWLAKGGGRQDPLSDSAWMNTTFEFFDENGHAVHMTGSQIIDTVAQLNYRYDDDPMVMAQLAPKERPAPLEAARAIEARQTLATSQTTASETRIQLSAAPVTVSLPLSESASKLLKARSTTSDEHKFILQLEDIQSDKPAGIHYEVYINQPQGEEPNFQSANYVGSLSFFGLKPHPMAAHGQGADMTQKVMRDYDITKIVRELITRSSWNPNEMSVTLVPRGRVGRDGEQLPMTPGIRGSFGKITLSAE